MGTYRVKFIIHNEGEVVVDTDTDTDSAVVKKVKEMYGEVDAHGWNPLLNCVDDESIEIVSVTEED
jgi:hypothetical protein